MADKAGQIVLSALSLAVADAAGLPLHATKSTPGLFPATVLGKQAAERCTAEGLLKPLSSLMREFHATEPTRSKAPVETFAITEKGYAYLFSQVSPRPVLEDLLRSLEKRQAEVAQADSGRPTDGDGARRHAAQHREGFGAGAALDAVGHDADFQRRMSEGRRTVAASIDKC